MSREIAAQELVRRMALGERLTVVDIRDMEDRVWSIPGSVHVPAYEDVVAGRLGALADVRPEGAVVTVCWAGKTSRLAADELARRGVDAVSLAGGMRAWSTAWDVAPVPVAGPTEVLQVRRAGKGCFSYVVANAGEAVVVDAALDPAVFETLLAARGWRLTAVLDTHVHADHVSRGPALAARTGVPYVLPENRRAKVAHRAVRDGDHVRVGGDRLDVLAVPGHTDESVAYVLRGRAAFTGDTLFPSTVGRPDLGTSPARARERARALHASLPRILALGDGVLVLAAHAVGDARPGTPAESGTVASARAALALPDEATFVERLVARLPPPPPHFEEIVALNVEGALPPDPVELEAGGNRCAAG